VATVELFDYWYDLGAGGLLPGQSYWVSYGPDDRFLEGTVILKASPSTEVEGTFGTAYEVSVLSVGDIVSTSVPFSIGDMEGLFRGTIGANITNAGQHRIRWFTVRLTIITP
jgi:hypothetical protein